MASWNKGEKANSPCPACDHHTLRKDWHEGYWWVYCINLACPAYGIELRVATELLAQYQAEQKGSD